jgi:uncharacterized protein
VRVWIDMTASAHVLVFRPLMSLLHGIDATVLGRHGGRTRRGKAASLLSRLADLRKWGRGKRFDIALAHGSHELTMTARRLGIPSSTTFDYEFAWLQHQLGCRAATAVVVPEAIPPDRLTRYGVTPGKLWRYEGLKEEYYLADFEPNDRVLQDVGVDRDRLLVVVRTPPDVSLYHRQSNRLFPTLLEMLGNDDRVNAVVVTRTSEQYDEISRRELPSVIVPERAVDAQSLIALSDLVVSAGGTMNREAVALGVPVYTTYGGRLGAVDEALIREGRLVPLTDPLGLVLTPRDRMNGNRVRRDPAVLLELLLKPLGVGG